MTGLYEVIVQTAIRVEADNADEAQREARKLFQEIRESAPVGVSYGREPLARVTRI